MAQRKKPHTVLILEALQQGKKITRLDAFYNYGCFALPQRIKNLRDLGYPIDGPIVKRGDKYVAEYSLPTTN